MKPIALSPEDKEKIHLLVESVPLACERILDLLKKDLRGQENIGAP